MHGGKNAIVKARRWRCELEKESPRRNSSIFTNHDDKTCFGGYFWNKANGTVIFTFSEYLRTRKLSLTSSVFRISGLNRPVVKAFAVPGNDC